MSETDEAFEELIAFSPIWRLEFKAWLEMYTHDDNAVDLKEIPESLLAEMYDSAYTSYLEVWLKQRTELLMQDLAAEPADTHGRFRRSRR
jgi:hypothetical protein